MPRHHNRARERLPLERSGACVERANRLAGRCEELTDRPEGDAETALDIVFDPSDELSLCRLRSDALLAEYEDRDTASLGDAPFLLGRRLAGVGQRVAIVLAEK